MPIDTLFYRILEISETATTEEVRKAYRKKALLHHPDKGGNPEEFKKISRAYEVLSDPEKRKIYDSFGEREQAGHPFDPIKIFQTFFHTSNLKEENSLLIQDLEVSLEEICTRAVKKIFVKRKTVCSCFSKDTERCQNCFGTGTMTLFTFSFPIFKSETIPCQNCSGTGIKLSSCEQCQNGLFFEDKSLDVFLTPELENGYKYKFEKEGNQHFNLERGLLIVNIVYKPHEVFQAVGKNLLCNLEVQLKMVLVGFTVKVFHPSGEILSIEITEIISPKNHIKKVPQAGISNSGDLLINFNINFPESLTEEQKNIVRNNL